ncbi:MAG TPA: NUDIX domain-containing protein [Caulobacteraceae bacterium]|nr:NUDIX domain-containing protein [Caulobacteraceae bacterium]
MSIADRIRVHDVHVLSEAKYVLKTATFDWRRDDGRWQTLRREVYDRGHGATLLPYDLERGTVLLTRQFRYPAFAAGWDDLLIEAPAGLLDDAEPEERIRLEVEEETGYRLSRVRKVFECFTSPGAVTETIHGFVGEYNPTMRVSDGGGVEAEGEDIAVLELRVGEAVRMVEDGRIRDAKTILLLQWAQLHLFPSARP